MFHAIRSLVVILILSGATFWVAGKALPNFLTPKEFKRWRNTWFIVTSIAFLAHNIWLFVIVTSFYILFLLPKAGNMRLIYALLLFCTLPLTPVEIPGFFGLRYLIKLNYPLILVFTIYLGLYLKPVKPRWFSLSSDRFVLLFYFLAAYSSFRDDTITNGLRESFIFFLKIVVPYFVVSRYLNDLSQLNRGLTALFLGIAPLSLIGVFETLKHWHVYDAMVNVLLGSRGVGGYDMRSGGLRASVNFGSPIVLGYIMVIAFGLLLYLRPFIENQRFANLAGCVIIACLLATMARGPWLGLVAMYFLYLWTGRESLQKIAKWIFLGFAGMPFLAVTSIGKKFLDLLPFIGTTRSDTVDYRARVVEQSWIVFKKHPWFGSTTFREEPEMEVLRQGQGIIDLVNSYVGVALPYGIVGLTLFLIIFVGLIMRCYLILNRIPKEEHDLLRLGRVLFAILCSIMMMIGTVSSIDYIPYSYWLFAGIVAAYLNVTEKTIELYKMKRYSQSQVESVV